MFVTIVVGFLIGAEARPEPGVAQDLILAKGKRLQLRPAVGLALAEAGGLDDLGDAVVVEFGKLGVPPPATAWYPERFATLNVGRLAVKRCRRGQARMVGTAALRVQPCPPPHCSE